MSSEQGVLLMFGLLFAYIIFPIWAARFAERRGKNSAGGVILLASFVFLGPIVALLYFLSALGSPLESKLIDQYQRQCLNCGGYRVNGRRANTKTKMYNYHCELCSYNWQWDWAQEKSWPNVQANLDLISKGEQKLAAEAEERRRQQEMAEAANFLRQQRQHRK
jgi:transcription elongation factor Elf1